QLIKNSTFKSAGYQVLSETPNLANFPNSSSQVIQFINPASGYSVGWKSTTFNNETCIVNNDVGDSQTAAFSVRVVIPPNGQGKLKFAYYQDCEEYWDGLRIFINGVLVDDLTVSGNYRVWEPYEIELQDGENIITFEFFKDESYSDIQILYISLIWLLNIGMPPFLIFGLTLLLLLELMLINGWMAKTLFDLKELMQLIHLHSI